MRGRVGRCLRRLGLRLDQGARGNDFGVMEAPKEWRKDAYGSGRMRGVSEENYSTFVPRFQFRSIVQAVLNRVQITGAAAS